MTADAGTVRLRPLTIVDEGAEALIGDPASGTFVSVPAVGAVVVRALQHGRTVDQAAAEAQRYAGEPVDVASFLAVLDELGFLVGKAGDAGHERPVEPQRTAPVQQRRWLAGPRPEHVRPLFSRPAWFLYAAAAMWSAACLVAQPHLWPRPADALMFADVGLSMLALLPLTYLLVGLHEAWHWLAARSLGLRARFGIDRRMYFLVIETDLSQLWSVPRRSRYGPQLAGLAIDAVVIAVLLAVQLVEPGIHLVEALLFVTVAGALWQCMIFLRTDVYGVLVTATGCRNLWRTKSLLLRQAFGRLTGEQRAELAATDPRDVRVGRWFRWLWLAGCVVAAGYFAVFYVPLFGSLLSWTAGGLASDPVQWRFWWTLAGSAVIYLPFVLTAVIAARELRARSMVAQ